MKKLILVVLFLPLFHTQALEVVGANTSGTSGTIGTTGTTGFIAPTVQTVQTTTSDFLGTFFGSPSSVGQIPPSRVSAINGIPYDVWMNGPVLSRYYNTNMYTANRNGYGINTTLPLVNQTTILGANSMSSF
jgi:hypothetical protein